MKRSLHRIVQKFHGEPWDIHRPRYEAMRSQLQVRVTERTARQLMEDDDDDNLTPRAAANCDMDCLSNVEISDGIAIIPISGIIGKHLSLMEIICGGGYDIQLLQDQVLALQNRADIHTVIFRIDSPGGQSCAWPDAAQMIVTLGESKRTIAYADLCAASAAYGLAAACNEIIVGTGSMVGSIETILGVLDESKAFEMEGLEMKVFTTGAYKSIGYDGASLTAEQTAWLKEQIGFLSTRFKDFIRSRRPDVKDEAMQGQWFTGEQAITAGLADAIAPSIYHVIAAALQQPV